MHHQTCVLAFSQLSSVHTSKKKNHLQLDPDPLVISLEKCSQLSLRNELNFYIRSRSDPARILKVKCFELLGRITFSCNALQAITSDKHQTKIFRKRLRRLKRQLSARLWHSQTADSLISFSTNMFPCLHRCCHRGHHHSIIKDQQLASSSFFMHLILRIYILLLRCITFTLYHQQAPSYQKLCFLETYFLNFGLLSFKHL